MTDADHVDRQLALAWRAFTPRPELRQRVRARIAAEAAAAGAGLALHQSLPVNPRPSSWAGRKLALSAGAAGIFGAGFIAGWLTLSVVKMRALDAAPQLSPAPSAAPASVEASSSKNVIAEEIGAAKTQPVSEASRAPAALAPVHEPPGPRQHAERSMAPRAATSAPSGAARNWRAELELLERAERAVRSDRVALALALLDDFDVKYPRSLLREERQAIEVMAHCQARATDANPRRERFERAHAASLYLERIRELCPRGMKSSSASTTPGAD